MKHVNTNKPVSALLNEHLLLTPHEEQTEKEKLKRESFLSFLFSVAPLSLVFYFFVLVSNMKSVYLHCAK